MDKTLVICSGGLDSVTLAYKLAAKGELMGLISFDYGQRHKKELSCAEKCAKYLGVSYDLVDISSVGALLSGSALTDDIEVPLEESEGIPVTYVPARNTIMLSLALGLAEVLHAGNIYIGVNAVDYSGYPDCRPEFIRAFQTMANLATKAATEGQPMQIHTPLLDMSKADIIRQGTSLGVDYSLTVSCYQADEEGKACGLCDSCRIRKAGFESANTPDPTRYKN